MSRKLNPFSGRQFLDANGDPYSGAQLFTYLSGTSTKETLTQDQAGNTNHANPIILNSKGEPAATGGSAKPMWQTDGVAVKLVLAPVGDTDPPAAAIEEWDELEGINDTETSGGGAEWVSGATPTYISATSLTLVGDVTTTYHPGRRIRTTNSGGTIYSTIATSVYTSLTTLVVVNDSGTLDAGISAIDYSILSSTNRALPTGKGVDIASAATITVGTDGRFFDITGTTAITAINAVSTGTVVKFQFDGVLTLTHHATNLILPGGLDIVTDPGDIAEFTEYAAGDWKLTNYESDETLYEHTHAFDNATTAWATATAYVVGDKVQASSPDAYHYFECTTAGTSHASTEPTWPTSQGDTVSDGTVTWTTRDGRGGLIIEESFPTPTTGTIYRHVVDNSVATGASAASYAAISNSPTIIVPRTGVYQLDFDMKSSDGNTVFAKIYRNPATAYGGFAAFGTEQSTGSTSFVTKTEASLSLNAGDELAFYTKGDGTSATTSVEHFVLSSAVKPFG